MKSKRSIEKKIKKLEKEAAARIATYFKDYWEIVNLKDKAK